jgi:hypothetical protein
MRSHNAIRELWSALGTVLLFTVVAASAQAGPLATTNRALNDGFGPDAGRWHGSATFNATVLGDTLEAEVDWAAFARSTDGSTGKFQLFLNDEGIAEVDPSAPGEVIYVYQIVSVGSSRPGVDILTLALDATDGRGTVSAPAFLGSGVAGAKAPTGGGDNTMFMSWEFDPGLIFGETSTFLIFTSPYAPEFDFLEVRSGQAAVAFPPLAASPSDRLFALIPEPGTLGLFVAGALAIMARRRARKS